MRLQKRLFTFRLRLFPGSLTALLTKLLVSIHVLPFCTAQLGQQSLQLAISCQDPPFAVFSSLPLDPGPRVSP